MTTAQMSAVWRLAAPFFASRDKVPARFGPLGTRAIEERWLGRRVRASFSHGLVQLLECAVFRCAPEQRPAGILAAAHDLHGHCRSLHRRCRLSALSQSMAADPMASMDDPSL